MTGDTSSTLSPQPFAVAAHGANGSSYAAHLTGNVASSSGFAQSRLTATSSAGVDLSQHAGFAFSVKGLGSLRAGMHTADMDKASNWDSYGKGIELVPTWRRYVVRFDDPAWSQRGFGAKVTFSSNQITAITFDNASTRVLDCWLDDEVLLKVN